MTLWDLGPRSHLEGYCKTHQEAEEEDFSEEPENEPGGTRSGSKESSGSVDQKRFLA